MRASCDSRSAAPCLTDDDVAAAGGSRPARSGVRELGLVAALYVTYIGSRLLAARDRGPAVRRARLLQHLEASGHLDLEHPVVAFLAAHHGVALLSCYWYSAAHYVVTPAALLWLYRRGSQVYVPARRALLVATVLGLLAYLALPTAPPRMLGEYPDILARHAPAGWWGADASAPRGLGGLTDELAAFPSLHAGWSLWVALVFHRWGRRRVTRLAGWAYAAVTAVVVIGTANHWVLDVLGGWLVVVLGRVVASRAPVATLRHRPAGQEPALERRRR